MKGKADIIDLGVRFDIELPHTAHVAKLALGILDGFSPIAGLTKADRRILYAAAILHDIAYAIDAVGHVAAGARVLNENPMDAFEPDEWQAVIAITLLHKRDWRSMLGHELFPKVGKRKLDRIRKLAAILRIADGLDHGHIQDARICYCKRGRKVDKVGVECDWYPGNIPWAEAKADLWKTVFKRPLRFEGRIIKSKKRFKGVVRRTDSAYSAARRIMYSQWNIMRDSVQEWLECQKSKPLRNYHMALERLQAALELFSPLLKSTSASDLHNRLDDITTQLTPVVDIYKEQEFLAAVESGHHRPQGLRIKLDSCAEAASQTAKAVFESEVCLQTVQVAGRLLRVELPRLERSHVEPSMAAFVAHALKTRLNRLVHGDIIGLHKDETADLDAVRHSVFQTYCYAEFAAPVLGRDAQRAAKHLKVSSSALDEIRQARHLAGQCENAVLRRDVEQRENDAWKRLGQDWPTFTES